ncbi:MAG TPA: hypothetical protein VGL81_10460 [Polyangiaceae bacterium]|jgi:hypothetical protein
MRPRFAFLLLPVFAAFLFAACQNQGEGQPCDTNAGNGGNDDCQAPLVCTTGLQNANSPRCCPQDRANATTPECSQSSTTIPDASPTPPDSETTEASSSEAAADAPAESASEAGPESGTEGDALSDGPPAEASGE